MPNKSDEITFPKFLALAMVSVFLFVSALTYLFYQIDKTIEADDCVELCMAHDGTMLASNSYGCTCKIDGWAETFRAEGLLD